MGDFMRRRLVSRLPPNSPRTISRGWRVKRQPMSTDSGAPIGGGASRDYAPAGGPLSAATRRLPWRIIPPIDKDLRIVAFAQGWPGRIMLSATFAILLNYARAGPVFHLNGVHTSVANEHVVDRAAGFVRVVAQSPSRGAEAPERIKTPGPGISRS